jgi:DNA-binding NarL/FixJ family response regulator
LLSAIHGAHAGDTLLDPSIVNALVRRRLPSALDVLSIRELGVLAEKASGHANNEIARHLALSKKSVERHVTSIFRKLRLPDAKRYDRRVTAVLTYLQANGRTRQQQRILVSRHMQSPDDDVARLLLRT